MQAARTKHLRGLDWTNQILRGMSSTGRYDPRRSLSKALFQLANLVSPPGFEPETY